MKLSNKLLLGGAGFLVLFSFAMLLAVRIGAGAWLESIVGVVAA